MIQPPDGIVREEPDGAYLRLTRITKSYGSLTVVQDASLAVRRGEVLTILGPSGCGKTTTLKIVAGFVPADSGSVTMDGHAVDRLSSHDRGAAMVFQNYALFPHLTVAQNVAFGLRMRGIAKPQIAREVGEMLERVRLDPFGARYPRELSGGQQQRVALARALIIKPKVLLLDEPFSSLDAKLRKQLRREFLEIHRAFGITSIFVTHDLEEAFALSDKVAVMNVGVVEQTGTPSAIFSRPRSRFVAEFVGHKNILDGHIASTDAATSLLELPGMTMRVPAAPAGPATVSIPVHRVQIARAPIAAANAFPAILTAVTYLGPFMQLGLRVAGIDIECQLPSAPDIEALRPGDGVHAGWDAADVIMIPR
jgi:putative spermidine/putrescine transport system ATP-binding protein